MIVNRSGRTADWQESDSSGECSEELVSKMNYNGILADKGKPSAEPIARDREPGRIAFLGTERAGHGAIRPRVGLDCELNLA